MSDGANDRAVAWFRRNTVWADRSSTGELAEMKNGRGLTIAACLPALNEGRTIGPICAALTELRDAAGLIDEIVVIDTGSTDDTVGAATANGARVHAVSELEPHHPGARGKGAALWKSVAAVESDIVVWLDSDVRRFSSGWVGQLVAPLLTGEARFAKGFYRRPLVGDDGTERAGGARVTELTARPLLAMFFPELSGFVQPLAGEVAAFRSDLSTLPFFSGYGVDIGLLIDVATHVGLDAMTQVHLGPRTHRHRDLLALGRTSSQVLQVVLMRAHEHGRIRLPGPPSGSLRQFPLVGDDLAPLDTDVGVEELPALNGLRLQPRGSAGGVGSWSSVRSGAPSSGDGSSGTTEGGSPPGTSS